MRSSRSFRIVLIRAHRTADGFRSTAVTKAERLAANIAPTPEPRPKVEDGRLSTDIIAIDKSSQLFTAAQQHRIKHIGQDDKG